MPLRRQWFKPGRNVERVARLSSHPFFTRGGSGTATAGRTPSRPRLVALSENVGALFSIVLSLVLIVAIVALVVAFAKEIRRQAIYLDPIDVPDELVKRGYTPAVVTDRMLDRVRVIQGEAPTVKPRQGFDTNATQVDIQVPGGAMSMKALVRYARSMLDLPEQHLAGEITRDGDHLTLLLRLRDRQKVTIIADRITADTVDGLAREGGEAIVRAADPYVLASYWFTQESNGLKFERTLAEIRYVLAHPPASDDAWANTLWGNVLVAQGDREAAIAKYRQAVAMDPEGTPAYSNLLAQLIESGRRDEAIAVINRAAALPAPSAVVLTGLGDGHATLGNVDRALEMYRRAAAVDPTSVAPHTALAVTYYRTQRYDDAEREAQAAIDRQAIPLPYLISIGVAADQGRMDDARTRLDQLKAFAPPSIVALADGFLRVREHRYPEAVALYEQSVIGTGTNDPYAWYTYGRALAGTGRWEAALAQYDRSLSYDRLVETLTYRAAALAALGRYDEALASLRDGEKVAPDYAFLHQQWARVLAKMGRSDEAAARQAKADALARAQHVVLAD
ncbi:MAG: tetratricopeptide repeat protein [Burkholderiales bacterium]